MLSFILVVFDIHLQLLHVFVVLFVIKYKDSNDAFCQTRPMFECCLEICNSKGYKTDYPVIKSI